MKLIRTQDMYENWFESLLKENFYSPEFNTKKAYFLKLIWHFQYEHELKLIKENFKLINESESTSSLNLLTENYLFRRIKFNDYEKWQISMPISDVNIINDISEDVNLEGSVICLLHMVDPYILAGALAKYINQSTSSKILLLRNALNTSEERIFSKIVKWAGVEEKSEFLNHKSTSAIKRAVREVKKGAILLSYTDMPSEFGAGRKVDFLGKPAWFSHGLIDLSDLTGNKVFVAWLSKAEKGHINYTLHVREIFSKNKAEKSYELTKYLESVVRKSPSDWDFIYSLRTYFYNPTL
jgi:lauroyl/myristoyl acyltransferase